MIVLYYCQLPEDLFGKLGTFRSTVIVNCCDINEHEL